MQDILLITQGTNFPSSCEPLAINCRNLDIEMEGTNSIKKIVFS